MLGLFSCLAYSYTYSLSSQSKQIEDYSYYLYSGDKINIVLSGNFVVRITKGYGSAYASSSTYSNSQSVWGSGTATITAYSSASVEFVVFRIPSSYTILKHGESSASYSYSELTSNFKGCLALYSVKKLTYTLKYEMSSSDYIYVYGPSNGYLNYTYSSYDSSSLYTKTFEGERMMFCLYSSSYYSPSRFEISTGFSFDEYYLIAIGVFIIAILPCICCCICCCCAASCQNPEKKYSSSSSSKQKPKVIIQNAPGIYAAPPPQMYSPPPYYANGPSFGVSGNMPPMNQMNPPPMPNQMSPPPMPNPMSPQQAPNMGYQLPPNSYGGVDPYQQAFQNEEKGGNPYIL